MSPGAASRATRRHVRPRALKRAGSQLPQSDAPRTTVHLPAHMWLRHGMSWKAPILLGPDRSWGDARQPGTQLPAARPAVRRRDGRRLPPGATRVERHDGRGNLPTRESTAVRAVLSLPPSSRDAPSRGRTRTRTHEDTKRHMSRLMTATDVPGLSPRFTPVGYTRTTRTREVEHDSDVDVHSARDDV